MSAQQADSETYPVYRPAWMCNPELARRLYPARLPMDQLPNEYRVTDTNPKPPFVHFGIPVNTDILHEYVAKNDLYREEDDDDPDIPIPIFVAAQHLSKIAQYDLDLEWPFKATADCGFVLAFYNNYSMEEKRLIEEDEEDVIQLVQEALGYDKSIRPRWYFDVFDPWKPGQDQDEDSD